MNKFDIILFENQENSANHKYDMCLIGRMLKENGFSVAVLDVYGQDANYSEMYGIEVIHPIKNAHVPNKSFLRIPHVGKINNIIYNYLLSQYYDNVMKTIGQMADMFYCGSYNCNTPASLLKQDKPCFFWGLRSSRVGEVNEMIRQNVFNGLKFAYLKHLFFRNSNNYFFYSNELIKNEFIELRFPENRLVHREERCVEEEKPVVAPDYAHFSILSIGQLRPSKHIDSIINAFIALDDDKSRYYIIGKSYNDYEGIIKPLIEGKDNIIRINRTLDDETFNSYFDKTHFLVLADEKAPSSVTNGTMMEALIHRRPIIAPSYNPYSYYIKKYEIGLEYNPETPNSLLETIVKAKQIGCMGFIEKIDEFIKTLSFKANAKQLSADLRRIQAESKK